MSSIQTGIELNDQFTSVIYGIINAVNLTISTMEDMQQTMNTEMDTSSIEGVRDEINQATIAMNELNAAMQGQTTPDIVPPVVPNTTGQVINADVNPVLPDLLVENPEPIRPEIQPNAPPEPVEVPIQWVSDNVEVFTSTGIERFQQEVQSTNDMLEQLCSIQDAIAKQAYNTRLLPPEAFQDLNSLAVRIDTVRDRIQQIENNPINFGTDTANAELEQLRSQLNGMIQQQSNLNQAIQNMDVSAANEAYLRLSQTVGNTERYIRDNVDEQGRFNQAIQQGTQQADNLMNTIKNAVGAYVSIQAVTKALDISDELVQTTSRLNMMNDGVQTTEELVNMVYAAATMMATGATFAQTAAQYGLNAALAACPLTWIILLIIALIAVIFAVCSAIAKMTGVAESGFGVICGGVNVVIPFFKNLGLSVANIALGIGNAIAALASNIMTAFHNAICNVQSWWYDLLSTCLSVIESICAALNKLPFVEFDYSGISSAADDYAAKASEAAGNKEEYTSISDAFNEGMSTFDTFQDGWVSDAFNAGASWGDGVAEAVDNFSLSDLFGSTDIPNVQDYTSQFTGLTDSLDGISTDTGNISDAMEITDEDLKYLRDIASCSAINRFTIAEINIDQSGMQNTVNNGQDLDGFMSDLTDSVNEAIDSITEGVHE